MTYRLDSEMNSQLRHLALSLHGFISRQQFGTGVSGTRSAIESPTDMNQHPLGKGFTTIPKKIKVPTTLSAEGSEHLVFDKAEEAERREQQKDQLEREIQDLEASLKEALDTDKIWIKKNIESTRERLKTLEESELKSPSEVDVAEQSLPAERKKLASVEE